MEKQKTIKNEVSLSGVGLHTGAKAEITLKPLPENSGIWFQRVDNPDKVRILADIDNVTDISRGTTISSDGVKVSTIEHIMAAFFGASIDNVLVEINNEELPILDGSSACFLDLIKKAGPVEQDAERLFIEIDRPLYHEVKGSDLALSIMPSEEFRLTFMIDYANPALGVQHTTMFDFDEFEKEYAPARTFCFLSEIEHLREKGLIKGGSIKSAVVVQDKDVNEEEIAYFKKLFGLKENVTAGKNGFLNNESLRFKNELCRHKALDLMGDFYLLGAPMKAFVLAARSGHAANIEMARRIRKEFKIRKRKETLPVFFGIDEIKKILPHRYPFLLVDRVTDLTAGKNIRAYKNVSVNEEFFNGHFPDFPVMPGVLQVEGLAQTGGLLMAQSVRNIKNKNTFFMSLDNVKFRRPVRPGDRLNYSVEIIKMRGNICKFSGKADVDGNTVCESVFMISLVDKESK
ncbi:MAG: bifunctional UDP-3-O-[3-hydroxymyristoyl] N-acetylglucosamine deacetylase/3-hydroxyacyl-ACP dehydratase [Fibrobacterota bacterium]